MTTATRELEDLCIRLDQASKDGKVMMSIPTTVRVIRLILRAIKENNN